jgi:hypothetical protein
MIMAALILATIGTGAAFALAVPSVALLALVRAVRRRWQR